MRELFRTKPLTALLAEAADESHGLQRTLGRWNLLALGIGAIIGAGIFVMTGTVAAQFTGPGIVYAFLVAGLACAFAGLCYAEFAAFIPIAGSAYTYGYATLGELIAWIIGWDLVLEYAFGAATVASGWGGNLTSLLQDFGWHLPPAVMDTPGTVLVQVQGRWEPMAAAAPALRAAGLDPAALPQATAHFHLLAFLPVLAITAILVVGMKESARFNAVMVGVKVATVLVFLGVAGAFLLRHPELRQANWTPFLPPNTGTFGAFGWSGVARASGVIFFAYIGFDAVSTAAQEAKDPQRDMPFGILGSLAVCTVLYILVGLVLTGVVHYSRLNVAAPVALGIDATGVRWGSFLVKAGTFAGLGTTMLVMLLGQSRVFYSMGRDGLLPGWASAVHPRFRTPWISTLLVGGCVALFSALIPIGALGQLVAIGTLLAFIIVCAGVWTLRRRQPGLPRPFRTPWVPFVPIMGIVISLGMMASLPRETWFRLVAWLGLGLILYFGYGRRHSRVGLSAGRAGDPPGRH